MEREGIRKGAGTVWVVKGPRETEGNYRPFCLLTIGLKDDPTFIVHCFSY